MFTNECVGATHARHSVPSNAMLKPVDRNRWGQRALTKTAFLQRDLTLAKRYLDSVAQKAKLRKDMPAYASALNELAYVNILQGKTDIALFTFKQIQDIWKDLHVQPNSIGFNNYIFFLWDYALFLRGQGENAMADRLDLKLERLSTGLPRAFVCFSRAERLADRGQFALAEQFYEEAFIEAGLRKDLNMQLRVAERLAPVYQVTGKEKVAISLLEQKAKMDRARCVSMFGRREC